MDTATERSDGVDPASGWRVDDKLGIWCACETVSGNVDQVRAFVVAGRVQCPADGGGVPTDVMAELLRRAGAL